MCVCVCVWSCLGGGSRRQEEDRTLPYRLLCFRLHIIVPPRIRVSQFLPARWKHRERRLCQGGLLCECVDIVASPRLVLQSPPGRVRLCNNRREWRSFMPVRSVKRKGAEQEEEVVQLVGMPRRVLQAAAAFLVAKCLPQKRQRHFTSL